MSALRQPRTFTFEEYLLIERNAPYKSEYLDEMIFAMSGGSGNHSFIAVNIATALTVLLRRSGCRVANSDLRVADADLSFSAYPDVSVVCGTPDYLDDSGDVLLNPCLVVEVLSPSTESYDRGEKFERYKRIDSLTDYLLVSQEEPLVELWRKEGEGWILTPVTGMESEIPLPLLGIALRLTDLYEGVL